jgi:hypothetical protein
MNEALQILQLLGGLFGFFGVPFLTLLHVKNANAINAQVQTGFNVAAQGIAAVAAAAQTSAVSAQASAVSAAAPSAK